jgi:hypothetical protein
MDKRVFCDALSVSIPSNGEDLKAFNRIAELVFRLTGETWNDEEKNHRHGMMGWTSSRGGKLSRSTERCPQNAGYVYLSLLGQSMSYFEKDAFSELLRWLAGCKAKCTRFDSAVDVIHPPFSLGTVTDAYELGQCVTRSKTLTEIKERDRKGNWYGHTLYFGSRESQTFARWYDKGLESGMNVRDFWLRLEVESKAEIADNLFQGLARLREGNGTEDMILSEVVRALDFREMKTSSARTNTSKRCPWYEAVVSDATARYAPTPAETPLERKKRWLERSVAPALYEVGVALGSPEDYSGRLLTIGKKRVRGVTSEKMVEYRRAYVEVDDDIPF